MAKSSLQPDTRQLNHRRMGRRLRPEAFSVLILGLSLAITAKPGTCQEQTVHFTSESWVIADGEVLTRWGRECLNGTAYLPGTDFKNGVIDVDLAVTGERAYPGIYFRMQEGGNLERIYVRPHRAGLYTDAIQYTPVFNGIDAWQLWNGEGFTSGTEIPENEWIHLRLEVIEDQARLFIGDMATPAMEVPELKRGVTSGMLGLMGRPDSTACFSNFRFRPTDDLAYRPHETPETPAGTIMDWEISRAFPADRIDRNAYPGFTLLYQGGWQPAQPETSGLVDVSRLMGRSGPEPELVFARTMVESDTTQYVTLSFGYSDRVDLFVNQRKVFSAESRYGQRDPSFLGVIGPHDAVTVRLEKGLNEIFLMLTENLGGWGFLVRADRELARPRKRHGGTVKLWETAPEFLTPESVLYDPEREVLYVTSYDIRPREGPEPTGFISKLSLDGRILDLHWIEGLNRPAGMDLAGDRLFTLERGHLTEIDIPSGRVVERYPIPGSTFLNDLVIAPDSSIYMTDTSNNLFGRIWRFAGGEAEVWLESDEINRANGLFLHDSDLLVGNTGDGVLKAVSLAHRTIRDIAAVGGGIIDGIRVLPNGSYLVSLWEGLVFTVTPSGEVTEILDLRKEPDPNQPQVLGTGPNTADFELIPETGTLILPTFLTNQVMAFQLLAPLGEAGIPSGDRQ